MPPSLTARLIARAYPPALRRSHGADIAETLTARWRERRGLRARVRFAGDLIADIAITWRQARVPLMRNVTSDFRDAIRLFRRGPLFAAGAVITLALGVGTTSAILSLADATVLRPLPIPDADQVVQTTFSFSHPDFRDLAAGHRTLTDLSAWSNAQFAVERRGDTVQVLGAGVSGRYFALTGQTAIAGRLLQDEDDTSAGSARAVISERLWTRVYHRDPEMVGATVLVNRRPVTIVGISPAAFRGTSLQFAPELFVTLAHLADLSPGFLSRPGTMTNRGTVFLTLAGRLKPGTDADQASDDARRIYYAARPPDAKPDTGAWFVPMLPMAMGTRTAADLRRFVTLLVGAGGLAMLLTCATVANLLLVRADRRRHELGVRAALGAGRARLSRLLLVESLAIGAAGALAGVAVAYGTLQLLGAYALPGQIAIGDLGLTVNTRLLARHRRTRHHHGAHLRPRPDPARPPRRDERRLPVGTALHLPRAAPNRAGRRPGRVVRRAARRERRVRTRDGACARARSRFQRARDHHHEHQPLSGAVHARARIRTSAEHARGAADPTGCSRRRLVAAASTLRRLHRPDDR